MTSEQNLCEEELPIPQEPSEELDAGQLPSEQTGQPELEILEEISPEEELVLLRQQLAEERRKGADLYDQYLRSVAELRNFKKRIEQERGHLSREANAILISQLLPLLDDMERAMDTLPDEKLRHFSWIEGILLIQRRFQAILEQHGLRSIEAAGRPFDPYMHEAILFEEVPAERDQTVLAELQKGYKLYDRVLRPTLVKVGKAAPAPTETKARSVEEESPSPPPEDGTETGESV